VARRGQKIPDQAPRAAPPKYLSDEQAGEIARADPEGRNQLAVEPPVNGPVVLRAKLKKQVAREISRVRVVQRLGGVKNGVVPYAGILVGQQEQDCKRKNERGLRGPMPCGLIHGSIAVMMRRRLWTSDRAKATYGVPLTGYGFVQPGMRVRYIGRRAEIFRAVEKEDDKPDGPATSDDWPLLGISILKD
jgi:hypothetical protein